MPSPNHRARQSGSLSLANTGAAVRRGDLKISDPILFDEAGGSFNSPNTVPPTRYLSGQQSIDATWPRKSTLTQDVHVRHVSDAQPQIGTRTSAGPSLLQSSMSSVPSKASLTSKRPSGLRAAIRRMFSSKQHRSMPTATSDLHYAESGHLQPVTEQRVRTRLDSAPPLGANFVTRGAALTSHATAYQQLEAANQDLSMPSRRGRRNSLPSLVFNDKDSILVPTTNDWPSAQATETENRTKEAYVLNEQFKRRSRSADALSALILQDTTEQPTARDRADEIAFWRKSAMQNPIPVYSGQSITVDPSLGLVPVTSTHKPQQASTNMSPMQNFDFGLGSPKRSDSPLEQRVNTLEVKVFDFEFALAKLQGHNVTNPRLKAEPFSRSSLHNIFPRNETKSTLMTDSSDDPTYLSSADAEPSLTFLSSSAESPLPSPRSDDVFRPQRASKATTATIRPASARRKSQGHSRESSRSSIHIPAHKFGALLELVEEEKAARLRLAEQVLELQKEVETLRMPVYATIREAYPTPSPESSQYTPGAPRAKTLHRTQAFSLEHSSPPPEVSRFSGTEDSELDDGVEDVYETPKEEQRGTFETARGSPRLVKL